MKLITTIYRCLLLNFVFVFLLYDTHTQSSRYIMNIFEFRTTNRSCFAILHFEEADLDRKRPECFLSASCGSRGEFFLTESGNRRALRCNFSLPADVYIIAIHAIPSRHDEDAQQVRPRFSPSSKNVGATPILADGKSAWIQGGSASSHDSSSPIFSPFLPPLLSPYLLDVTLTPRLASN